MKLGKLKCNANSKTECGLRLRWRRQYDKIKPLHLKREVIKFSLSDQIKRQLTKYCDEREDKMVRR